MRLLVDGHNLIGKIPDIDLEDEQDEAKLVSRLRRFAARTGNKLTVLFDGGLPGGASPELSGASVQVIFAPAGQIADPLIINRIRGIRDRDAWMVVSSDWSILDAATQQGVRVQHSEEFAITLAKALKGPKPADLRQTPPSEKDVDEWLEVFSKRGRGRMKTDRRD